MGKVLIIARGGYGDIFPLLAIGAALQRRGHAVAVAAEGHHAAACADLGLPLHILDGNGAPAPDAGGWRARLDATLAPDGLRAEVERLLPLAAANDLLLGNQLAYAGAIVHRLLGKPWVFCAASPLAIPSRHDPPLWPVVDGLQRRTAALGWPETPYLHLARVATRVLMRSQLALQARLGLPTRAHPRFEGMYSERLNLLATSPLLLAPQPDWPAHTVVTGFGWYEPRFLGDDAEVASLQAFAQAGPPPLVVTAGGGRRTSPGRFFEQSIAAARYLGRRVIVVAGQRTRDGLAVADDVRLTGYLPYSRLFGLGAAVVHSGGIGTIGWALRAAAPSLLVPADWDQHDNARRAARHGFARVLPMACYTARAAAGELAALLDDRAMRQRLADAAPKVAAEDGARIAADRIEQCLGGCAAEGVLPLPRAGAGTTTASRPREIRLPRRLPTEDGG